jgi:uncharacterized protein (UPF0264 family)
MSVALGELSEWSDGLDARVRPDELAGIRFCKFGLAGAGPDVQHDWDAFARQVCLPHLPVAVAYADWFWAKAPHPDRVLDVALRAVSCGAILVDTWDKSRPSPLVADAAWKRWFDRIRRERPVPTVVAGGIDEVVMARLAPLKPDYFAVRGAACTGGDRQGTIDRRRVAALVAAAVAL